MEINGDRCKDCCTCTRVVIRKTYLFLAVLCCANNIIYLLPAARGTVHSRFLLEGSLWRCNKRPFLKGLIFLPYSSISNLKQLRDVQVQSAAHPSPSKNFWLFGLISLRLSPVSMVMML
jgi:hypothetical protein